ncbi:MAG: DUF1134 domain-containing protein [Alphaproteobacteria bacterium]|nr:DUF1134 domain-containing protein [Alphaproteobacteria bacterium]
MKNLLAALILVLSLSPSGAALADASDEYSQDEIFQAASGFFASSSRDLANAIAKAFEDNGRPNAYITGEEASGAIGIGLRYGNGVLTRKRFDLSKIYWQGPSIGFDLGGDASKVFILIYRLQNTDQLYQRIPGADGSAYLIGGVSVSYLQTGNLVLAPITTGVGLRLGVNVGYLHFGPDHSWNPL